MHLKTIPILIALGLSVGALFARELKEFDNDVNYDEARVPHYDLPDPLITAEGKPVTTAEQWRNVRRPQILSLFANFVYGAVPCLLYTSPSPRDVEESRMPSSA